MNGPLPPQPHSHTKHMLWRQDPITGAVASIEVYGWSARITSTISATVWGEAIAFPAPLSASRKANGPCTYSAMGWPCCGR